MSVLYVMLISIGAPVLIILCALLIVVPLIMDTKPGRLFLPVFMKPIGNDYSGLSP